MAQSASGRLPAPSGLTSRFAFRRVSHCQPKLRISLRFASELYQAIERDGARGKPTFLGSLEHRLEMVILGQAIIGSIKQAVIAWDGVCVVTPHERDQVDAG